MISVYSKYFWILTPEMAALWSDILCEFEERDQIEQAIIKIIQWQFKMIYFSINGSIMLGRGGLLLLLIVAPASGPALKM